MEADDLLCSRNARPGKALVGHVQWEIILSARNGERKRGGRSMRAVKDGLVTPWGRRFSGNYL